jgi:hypothetical protein
MQYFKWKVFGPEHWSNVAEWLEQHPEGFVAGEPYLAPA